MSPDVGPLPGGEQMPDAPHLSVRTLRMFVLHFCHRQSEARLEQVWREAGLPLSTAYLDHHSNFVSLRFTEDLVALLERESGDPEFASNAGRVAATPEALGFTYYLLKAFASPRQIFKKVVELGPSFNRVGEFSLEKLTATEMVLAYRSSVPERSRALCKARLSQFSSFPTVCGVPAAEAEELECQVRGAPACKYRLRWQEPRRALMTWLGAAAGCGLGLVVAHQAHGSPLMLAPAVGLAGAAIGAWRETVRTLHQKNQTLEEQTEGLTRSMFELQRRTEELHQLNLELEGRVAQRTAELSEALTKARELDRLKTEFFDNISHELRTPLSLILLSLESLTAGEGSSPQALRQHLDTMERSASRLLRLVNQLLDLAKLEAGKLRLRYEPVDLHALLSSLLLPFQQLAQKREVALSLEGAPAEPVQVDAERIDVVFQNLLSNALKFSRPGGKVKVAIRELSDAVEVEVADDGVGIPAADLPVIFNRFAQADSQGIKRFGGTGIGLALVRETLEAHGGSIAAKSDVGVGTTFTVRLPRGSAHVREDLRERRSADMPVPQDRRGAREPLVQVQPRPPASAPADEPAATVGPDAARILVVEDDPDLRRVIVAALRAQYRVIEADDGIEGLEKVKAETPDLVVTDLMMPRRSGLQLIRELREDPATAELPAVLLTARRETESLVEALGGGANDFLAKPFATRELLARVAVQLRLREAAVRSAAAERLSALGLLTSGFAHEVRNPLNGLLNAVEPLRSSVRAGSARDAEMLLDVMRDCGERIQKLAEALLGFARPGAPDMAVDVAATLESTLSVLSWRIAPGVKVVRELAANPTVRGDASALGQVWLNLLDNALRAIGREGEIAVRTAVEQGALHVSISDNGPGMSESVQAKLFQPFFSTRPAGEGTGLGLALSRRIVFAHGGRISVKSAPGAGTTFTVELPLARPERATGS